MTKVKGESAPIAFRIPPTTLQLIDHDVQQSGEFMNRTDWIRKAIDFYIESRGLRRGGGLTHRKRQKNTVIFSKLYPVFSKFYINF